MPSFTHKYDGIRCAHHTTINVSLHKIITVDGECSEMTIWPNAI